MTCDQASFFGESAKVGGTLGARDFSSAVSGFCQVFIVTRATTRFSRGFGVRPKADTENSRLTREKPLVAWVSWRTPPMQTGMDKDRLIARPNTISNA